MYYSLTLPGSYEEKFIQCKDILDPPSVSAMDAATVLAKWFLEHNNELVCVQTF